MTERETKRLERISEKLEQIKAQRNDILARDKNASERNAHGGSFKLAH